MDRRVHLDNDKEMVYIEVVVHESNCVGMGVVLCMVYLAHKVVGMVDTG